MNQINPEKFYTLSEIVKLRFLPWINNVQSMSNWVKRDLKSENILKPIITGQSIATRYLIKGERIIEFLTRVEDGSLYFGPERRRSMRH